MPDSTKQTISAEGTKMKRIRRPPKCEGCGVNRSDPPSKLCPGCKAYKEHQS